MRYVIFALAMFSFVRCMADNARFRICAVDERTAIPLSEMKVKAVFVDHFLRWENATVDHEIDGRTDLNGRYVATGNTNCGKAGFCFRDNDGFYDTRFIWVPFDANGKPMPLLQWWKPDNQVVTVRLQRVEHPIPLYVKRVELRDYERGIGGFDGTNSVLRFDLMKGDWLPPYGKGEVADMTISSTLVIKERERFRFEPGRYDWLYFYELRNNCSLSESDGISELMANSKDGIKIRSVTNEPAQTGILRMLGKKRMLESNGKDWCCERFDDRDNDRCYTFRIRTRRNDKGELVEAYYGKIYGDFEFEGDDKKGLIGVKFLYYLNPKSLDRNLEWDMRTNLCPTAGKHESQQP